MKLICHGPRRWVRTPTSLAAVARRSTHEAQGSISIQPFRKLFAGQAKRTTTAGAAYMHETAPAPEHGPSENMHLLMITLRRGTASDAGCKQLWRTRVFP